MQTQAAKLGAQTRLVALLGHPIGHSLSPRIHNAAFRAQGVDMVYVAFDVLPESLAEAIDGLRALGIRGANLTIPHKEAAVALVDEIDSIAARIGAVNTIVNNDNRLVGYNTDAAGFAAALGSLVSAGARGLRCLVLGAGGAARAVVATLVEQDAAEVRIYNRTGVRASALCETASLWGATACSVVSEEELRAAVETADLVVNATSLGLGGSVKESPIPVDTLHSDQVVIDLVYGASLTALVEAARAKGAGAADGKEMLVMQAACSYRLWTGLEPAVDVMRGCVAMVGEGEASVDAGC